MFGETSLMRMVIEDLAELHKWSYEDTFDKFYNSKVCVYLSDKRTGFFTFAPKEIIELFEEEILLKG